MVLKIQLVFYCDYFYIFNFLSSRLFHFFIYFYTLRFPFISIFFLLFHQFWLFFFLLVSPFERNWNFFFFPFRQFFCIFSTQLEKQVLFHPHFCGNNDHVEIMTDRVNCFAPTEMLSFLLSKRVELNLLLSLVGFLKFSLSVYVVMVKAWLKSCGKIM